MKRFAVAVTIFAAGYFFAGAMQPDYQCEQVAHVAQEGDSLWRIAERFCTGEIDSAVDAMAAVHGTSIRIGQQVTLP